MKSRKRKRSQYVVRYVAARRGWGIFENGKQVSQTVRDYKADAVTKARQIARSDAPSELTIKTKASRIGKGSSSRSTYGADPKGSKG